MTTTRGQKENRNPYAPENAKKRGGRPPKKAKQPGRCADEEPHPITMTTSPLPHFTPQEPPPPSGQSQVMPTAVALGHVMPPPPVCVVAPPPRAATAIDPHLLGQASDVAHNITQQASQAAAAGARPSQGESLAVLMLKIQQLEGQLTAQQAGPVTGTGVQPSGAQPLAAAVVVPNHTIHDNVAVGSVPKPRGSAGGGQRGYHLQAAMGLGDTGGDKLYNMILATIRELVHATQIDLSREYRHVPPESLSHVFSMARRQHPYLARFERDWATAAIVKQYMSSARRYGRRKGYFTCAQEARATRRRNPANDGDSDED